MFSQLPRCQLTVRRSAHQLRLRRPALRGGRPHREVLCHSKGYQDGENANSAVQLLANLTALCSRLDETQSSIPMLVFLPPQKFRKIPEGLMPPSTPKYAYGRVAMQRVHSHLSRSAWPFKLSSPFWPIQTGEAMLCRHRSTLLSVPWTNSPTPGLWKARIPRPSSNSARYS